MVTFSWMMEVDTDCWSVPALSNFAEGASASAMVGNVDV
jgi:hypothetical protein